jgi:hypothetical protein
MQLGKKTQKTNQFLESLKAEGEVIIEDVQPSAVQSKSVLPPTDPITVTIEERLNIVVERNGSLRNFDLQGTLSLQILNQDDGFIQLQVCSTFCFVKFGSCKKGCICYEVQLGLQRFNINLANIILNSTFRKILLYICYR